MSRASVSSSCVGDHAPDVVRLDDLGQVASHAATLADGVRARGSAGDLALGRRGVRTSAKSSRPASSAQTRCSQLWHEEKLTGVPSVRVIASVVSRSLPQLGHSAPLRAPRRVSEDGWAGRWSGTEAFDFMGESPGVGDEVRTPDVHRRPADPLSSRRFRGKPDNQRRVSDRRPDVAESVGVAEHPQVAAPAELGLRRRRSTRRQRPRRRPGSLAHRVGECLEVVDARASPRSASMSSRTTSQPRGAVSRSAWTSQRS